MVYVSNCRKISAAFYKKRVTQPNIHQDYICIKETLVRKIICYPFDWLFARFLRQSYNQKQCTWMSSFLLFLKLHSLFPNLGFREQESGFLIWTEAKLQCNAFKL